MFRRARRREPRVTPSKRFVTRRAGVALAVALVPAFLLLACGGEEESTSGSTSSKSEAVPPWIVSVEPRPGQQSATFRRIEVQHRVMTDGESVRLSVDGVDVTAYADFGREGTAGGPGLLVYDFEQARDFVPLDPGEHQATLTRVKLTGVGEKFEVLDDYTWSFSIQ